jgi:arabinogalactan endo-1,4-beta-galactosidase
MRNALHQSFALLVVLVVGCGQAGEPAGPNGTGATVGGGGNGTSSAAGGSSTSTSASSSGSSATSSGSSATSASSSGSSATSASSSGSSATSASSSGSSATSASSSGSSSSGSGSSSGAPAPTYYLGADITFVQADEAAGATYSDGTKKEILTLLKNHGFNYIRMRTFVDPKAADGYDKTNGYGDLAHTITFGKRVKSAGMGFLVDFHYSDNWADPGKQCVPVAWQSLTTLSQLATAVHDYTANAITQLIAGGARPDMVQIGNEITPGMLIHVCDANGTPTGTNPVSGAISNWTNLGTLLKAGVKGVKDVDPGIKIMLHIDRGNDYASSHSFIQNAMTQGVAFDVFGESCYTAYQGPSSGWQSNFTQLVAAFPSLKFVIAEYGPEQRAANDIIFGLPNQIGIGTFNWEPTHSGAWNTGHALFSAAGNAYTATADLSLYDQMKTAYASRL